MWFKVQGYIEHVHQCRCCMYPEINVKDVSFPASDWGHNMLSLFFLFFSLSFIISELFLPLSIHSLKDILYLYYTWFFLKKKINLTYGMQLLLKPPYIIPSNNNLPNQWKKKEKGERHGYVFYFHSIDSISELSQIMLCLETRTKDQWKVGTVWSLHQWNFAYMYLAQTLS